MRTTVLKMGTGRTAVEELRTHIRDSDDHRLHNLIVPYTTVLQNMKKDIIAVTLQYHEPEQGAPFYSAGIMDQDDFTYLIFEGSEQSLQLMGLK